MGTPMMAMTAKMMESLTMRITKRPMCRLMAMSKTKTKMTKRIKMTATIE